MKHTTTEVQIIGTIGGRIWMPACVCSKQFKVSNLEYPYTALTENGRSVKATLRDMILMVTNDGDFQSCLIADATVVFIRTVVTASGTITRRRAMDIRQFPSVADCVVEFESDEHYEILDAYMDSMTEVYGDD